MDGNDSEPMTDNFGDATLNASEKDLEKLNRTRLLVSKWAPIFEKAYSSLSAQQPEAILVEPWEQWHYFPHTDIILESQEQGISRLDGTAFYSIEDRDEYDRKRIYEVDERN